MSWDKHLELHIGCADIHIPFQSLKGRKGERPWHVPPGILGTEQRDRADTLHVSEQHPISPAVFTLFQFLRWCHLLCPWQLLREGAMSLDVHDHLRAEHMDHSTLAEANQAPANPAVSILRSSYARDVL